MTDSSLQQERLPAEPDAVDRASPHGGSETLTRNSRALLWRHVGALAVSLVGTLVLPLLLGAAEWGRLATALFVLAAIEGVLANNGISAYLIRCPNLDAESEAAANTLQVLLGAVILAALVLAGLCERRLTGESTSLAWLLPMAGAACFLISWSAVPVALLAKRMQFGRLAAVELSGTVAMYIACIALAALGGAAAASAGLAIRGLVMAVTSLLCVRPAKFWGLRRENVRQIASQASPVAAANLGGWFAESIMPAAAGLFAGTSAVGLYRIVYTIVNYPRVLSYILGRVLFSMLSVSKVDGRLSQLTWRTFAGSSLLLVPVVLTIAALAPLYVPLVFGNKQWQGLDVVFLLAGIHYALYLLAYIPGQALVAAGRSRDFAAFYGLHAGLLLAGVIGFGWAIGGPVTLPAAGIVACAANILLLARFRRAYPQGASSAPVWRQIVLLSAAAVGVWLLARTTGAVALGAWVVAIGGYFLLDRPARLLAMELASDLLTRRARAAEPAPAPLTTVERD